MSRFSIRAAAAALALAAACGAASAQGLLGGLKGKLTAAAPASAGEVKDYGMTSPTHAKYVGKIVFSPKRIEMSNEEEAEFKDRFVGSGIGADDINFMAYFARSFHNQVVKEGAKPKRESGKMVFTFTVNGKPVPGQAELDFEGESFAEWTGYSYQPLNDGISGIAYGSFFVEKVRPLCTEYENRVGVRISFRTEVQGKADWSPAEPMSRGEFVLVKEENRRDRTMPEPGMPMAAKLEQAVRKAVSGKDYKVLNVVFEEPDWTVVRNQLTGAILGRETRVATAVQMGDGSCLLRFYYVGQDYLGDRYSEAVYFKSLAYEEYPISYENAVKK